MPGSNRRSPCRIMRRHFDLLPGVDANPVIRHDKRAAYLVRHMTPDAASDPIHRAQTRMIRYFRAMTSQTRCFGSGDEHRSGRIPMRVVTICARNLTRALTPALSIFQCHHLGGNERIVRHSVFDEDDARMTLRAWPHLVGNRQFVRVQYAEVSRVSAERS